MNVNPDNLKLFSYLFVRHQLHAWYFPFAKIAEEHVNELDRKCHFQRHRNTNISMRSLASLARA